MKILELGPYALIQGHPGFIRNKTGLGKIIYDICSELSKKNTVFLLTQAGFTKGFISDKKVKICRRSLLSTIVESRPKHWINGFKACKDMNRPIRYKAHIMLYFISQGYAEKVIQKLEPEIAHIHTFSYYTLPYVYACLKYNIPMLITLHEVTGFLPDNEIDNKQRKLERIVCNLSDKYRLPISVVSSGMKSKLKRKYGLEGNDIHVVLNGCSILSQKEEIEEKWKRANETVTFICVGNVSENKNQIQIVRAFSMLRNKYGDSLKLIIVGDGESSQTVRDEIEMLGLSKVVQMSGHINHNEIADYYLQADINVVASHEEGFGLSIIESMEFGIPTVIFSDLDAVEDLFDKETMVLVDDRSDMGLSKGMEIAYMKKWDHQYIYEKSKQYELEVMGKDYEELLTSIISNWTTIDCELKAL